MAAPTLDATVSGEDSNTYITRDNATAYFDARLGASSWTSASDDDKDKSLLQATREVDNLSYYGCKRDIDQALDFPRDARQSDDGVWDLDADGSVIIPKEVESATCECALWLIQNDGDEATAEMAQRGVKIASWGKTSMHGLTRGAPSIVGPKAAKYLQKFFKRSGKINPFRDRYRFDQTKWGGGY